MSGYVSQTHVLVCATLLGIGADTVKCRCRLVGLVLLLVRLGQTHMLACATWLGIGADTISCRYRHS